MSDALPATEQASPGRALAAARVGLKLSVADVSQQIKYGAKQIAAIEADDYATLPGATFVRGMIRSYAKLVQIDPEPLLLELGRCDIPARTTVDLRSGRQEPFVEGGVKSNRVYVLLSIAALLAVAVVAYQWWSNPLDTGEVVTILPKAAKSDAPPAPADNLPAAAAAAAAEAPPAPAPEPAPAAATEPAATEPAAPEPVVPELAPPEAQSAAPVGAAAQGAGAPGRIELQFDDLSWVEIKQADGKVLLSQLNQPGTRRVVEGAPPFDVVIGNAAKVRMKYNDAALDLRPFFKVDVARLKLE
jgi:cytoskeleton protein RodZ